MSRLQRPFLPVFSLFSFFKFCPAPLPFVFILFCFYKGLYIKELTSDIQVVFFFSVIALLKMTSENPFPSHENVLC